MQMATATNLIAVARSYRLSARLYQRTGEGSARVASRSNLGAAKLCRRQCDELVEHAGPTFGVVTVPVSTMPCIELSLERVETDRVATAVRAGTRQGDLAIDPRVRAKRQISLGVRISPVVRLTPFPRDSNDLRVTAPLALQVDVRRVSSALMSSAVPIVVTRGPSLDHHGLTNLGVTATTLSVGACDRAERQHEKSEWKGKSHGESSVFDRCGLSRGSPMRRWKTLRSPYALGKS